MAIPGGVKRGKPRVVKPKPKAVVKPVRPAPEVSVQAKPRRGHAPTVFTESPIRNPIEKIQTKQLRVSARAIQNAAHAERGGADPGAIPAAPKRPLTNREAAKILNSGPARSVAATLPKIKAKKKGSGFSLTPAGLVHLPSSVISDIPKELAGKGALEGVVTRIGATSAKGWEMVPGVGHEVGNIVKDTSGVVAGAVPSVYLPAKEVVTGHPGKAGKMIYGGIKETLKHPAEHPVSLALILRGGEGAVSRGAGELVRNSPTKALREYGSTERTPISLGGTALETRKASKGLIENRAQKAIDRKQAAKQGTVVVKIPRRSGEGKLLYTEKRQALKPTNRQLNAPHVMGGKLDRRVDTEAGKHNVRVRDMRTVATNTMAKAKPSVHEDAVALVNEGVLKRGNAHRPLSPEMVRQDLQTHLDQLSTQREALKEPADLAHSAESIAQVERLLADQKFMANPKATLKAHFAGARAYAEALRQTDPARVKYGDLAQGQVVRRPLLPFAAREMGLVHTPDEGFSHVLTVPVVAKEVKSATTTVKNIKAEIARRTAPDYPLKLNGSQRAEMQARLATAERRLARVSKPTTVTRPVSNKTIIDAFERKGGDVRDLAYVPARDRSGTANFYGSGIRRPGAETKNFTGSAALAGTYPRSFDALHQHLVGASVRVARHESVNNLVNTFGLKQASGKYFDTQGAKQEIDNLKATTGQQYVAVTAARQKVPDALMEDLTPEQMQQTFHAAEPGDSHVVLFPKHVWDRLQEHEQGRGGPGTKLVQTISQPFRHVVLLTSTKWLAGNTLEGYLRMQINELTPVGVARTIAAGKKYEADLKKLGPLGEQKAGELQGAAGAGIFRSQHQLDLKQPEESLAKFAHAVRTAGIGEGKITKQIGPNGIANLWDKYSDAVTTFNGWSEQSVYYYALGKATRDEVKALTSSWARASRKAGPAYADVVRGGLDSNKIAEYARAVDDIRGRYTNLSPKGRYFVTTYTPFAPWYVNALHFFAITLPGHHPVKTGVLAAASAGTQEQRKAFNLPPWAQGIPMGGGRVLPIQNFLPTGITSNGLAGPTSLILPQISGIASNLKGQAWTGKQLPQGTSNLEMALNTAIGSFVPFASKAQMILEKGGKSAPNSTLWSPKVKDGTKKNIGAGIKKAVLPIRPQSTASATTGSPWGGAASSGSSRGSWGGAAGGSSGSSSGWGAAGG